MLIKPFLLYKVSERMFNAASTNRGTWVVNFPTQFSQVELPFSRLKDQTISSSRYYLDLWRVVVEGLFRKALCKALPLFANNFPADCPHFLRFTVLTLLSNYKISEV